MGRRVVCVSRTLGAGGEAIGRLVAERLGFGYFDDEVIAMASAKAGIDPGAVAAAEHHTSLVARLLARPSVKVAQEDARRFIHTALLEIVGRGDAVIVAHGASIALGQRKQVLRVLVTASVRTRAERLRQERKLGSEEDAARVVTESDRERALYLERFFHLHEEDPTLYDVLINTDALTIDEAVGAIVGAVRS